MTEENNESNIEIDLSKILTSILLQYKEISVPTLLFLKDVNEDRQLEIKYDNDTESFIFKLKDEDGTISN